MSLNLQPTTSNLPRPTPEAAGPLWLDGETEFDTSPDHMTAVAVRSSSVATFVHETEGTPCDAVRAGMNGHSAQEFSPRFKVHAVAGVESASGENGAKTGAGSPSDGRSVRPQSPPTEISPTMPAMLPEGSSGTRLELAGHETPASCGASPEDGIRKTECGSEKEWKRAQAEARVCQEFVRMTSPPPVGCGYSKRQAATALGRSSSWFSGPAAVFTRWQSGGAAALLRKSEVRSPKSELCAEIEALPWFIPAARFFNLNLNRTYISGSVPEAVRRTISLPAVPPGWTEAYVRRFLVAIQCETMPACPAELREAVLARQAAGQPLVPVRIARQIAIGRTLTEFTRNPTNAALRTMNAAGCSRFTRVLGEYEPLRCGQRMQPDDGSVNFMVCVPWKFPSDVCSRKWGVLVGRFQLLLFVDAMSLAIRARSFVVRPRSSYRQEDALHLYNIFMRQHGVPEEIWHEGHVWNSGRVKECLDLLGVRRHLVHSPHNKAAVEGRFNKLWTVLSGLTGGQIGRFRGEMEKENALLTSVRAGATDPRRVFPMIHVAVECIDQAIAEANATPVKTDVGTWIPDELWAEQLAQTPLPAMDPQSEWMFAPLCLERVVNNGFTTKVRLFEEFSVPFTFAAEFMPKFHGARARCYFDPWADRLHGTVVLAQNWEGLTAGTVLGEATQTNDIGNYARLMLGIGSGPSDDGRVLRQRQASALRSERRAITGDRRGLTIIEQRDGIDTAAKVEVEEGRGKREEGNSPLSALHSSSVDAERLAAAERYEAEHPLDFM